MDGGMASKVGEALCGGGGGEVGGETALGGLEADSEPEGASMVQIFLDSSWIQHSPKISLGFLE